MKKIIISLFLIVPSLLFGTDYFFYVNSPEEVKSYENIFNAISSIFQDDTYLSLLKLVFLFGGFIVFASGLFQSWSPALDMDTQSWTNGKSSSPITNFAKYSVVGVVLLTLVFSRDSTIIVKTNNIPDFCSTSNSSVVGTAIDNVPELLSYSFTTINRIGLELTRLTETTFTNPNTYGSTNLSDNRGYLGAIKSSAELLNTNLSSLTLSSTIFPEPVDGGSLIRTIYKDCIFIPFSSKGEEGLQKINEIKSSKDIASYIEDLYTTNPQIGGINARDYTAEIQGSVFTCGELYDLTAPIIINVQDDAACSFPGLGSGAIQLITGNKNPTTSDFKQTVIQSGLISELETVNKDLSIGIKNSGYNIGKSKADFLQTQKAKGVYTAEMLPFLQSVIRSIIYAFFPFVFVIVLLPNGLTVLGQYFKSILWVELWTPTAAIVNMFLSNQAETKMSTIFTKEGMTFVNSVDLLSVTSTISGVGGYLFLMIPALIWMVISGGSDMLSSLGSGIAEFASKHIDSNVQNADTKLLAKKTEANNSKEEMEKSFSLAEMEHYQAVQDGRKEGAVLGQQIRAGKDTVTESAAFTESKNLSEYSEIKKRMENSGTPQSIENLAKSLEAKKAFDLTNSAKAFSNLSPQEISSSGQEFIKKQMGELKGLAQTNNSNLTDINDYKALTMKEGSQAVKSRAEMDSEKAAHKEIIKKEEERRGRPMTEEEKDAFVTSRTSQFKGYKDSYDAQSSEQFADKIMGTANQLDQNNHNGLKGASHEQLKSFGNVARDTGDSTYRDQMVANETTQQLNSGPNSISMEDQAFSNVIETNQKVGKAEADNFITKTSGESVRQQAMSSNLEYTSNKNGEKTVVSLDKKGNHIAERGITGHKLDGLGDRMLQNITGLDTYRQLVAIKEIMDLLPIGMTAAILRNGRKIADKAKRLHDELDDKKVRKIAEEEVEKKRIEDNEHAKKRIGELTEEKDSIKKHFEDEEKRLLAQKKASEDALNERFAKAKQEELDAQKKFLEQQEKLNEVRTNLNHENKLQKELNSNKYELNRTTKEFENTSKKLEELNEYKNKNLENLSEEKLRTLSLQEKRLTEQAIDLENKKAKLETISENLEKEINNFHKTFNPEEGKELEKQLNKETEILREEANKNRTNDVESLKAKTEEQFNRKIQENEDKFKQETRNIEAEIKENERIFNETKSLEEKLADIDEKAEKELKAIKALQDIEKTEKAYSSELNKLKESLKDLSGKELEIVKDKIETLTKIISDLELAKDVHKEVLGVNSNVLNSETEKLTYDSKIVSQNIEKIESYKILAAEANNNRIIAQQKVDKYNDAINNKNNNLNDVQENLNKNIKDSIDKKSTQIENIESKINKKEAILKSSEEKLNELKKEVQNLQNTDASLDDIRKAEQELLKATEKDFALHNSISKEIEDLQKNISNIEQDIDSLSRKIELEQKSNDVISSLTEQNKELSDKYKELSQAKKEKNIEKINSIKNEIKELKSEISKTNELKKTIEKEINSNNNKIFKSLNKEGKDFLNKENEIKSEIRKMEKEKVEYEKEAANQERTQNFNEDKFTENEERLRALENEDHLLKEKLNELNSLTDDEKIIKAKEAEIEKTSKEIEKEIKAKEAEKEKLLEKSIEAKDKAQLNKDEKVKLEALNNEFKEQRLKLEESEKILTEKMESIAKDTTLSLKDKKAQINEIQKEINDAKQELEKAYKKEKGKILKNFGELTELKETKRELEKDVRTSSKKIKDLEKEIRKDFTLKGKELSPEKAEELLKAQEELKLAQEELSKKGSKIDKEIKSLTKKQPFFAETKLKDKLTQIEKEAKEEIAKKQQEIDKLKNNQDSIKKTGDKVPNSKGTKKQTKITKEAVKDAHKRQTDAKVNQQIKTIKQNKVETSFFDKVSDFFASTKGKVSKVNEFKITKITKGTTAFTASYFIEGIAGKMDNAYAKTTAAALGAIGDTMFQGGAGIVHTTRLAYNSFTGDKKGADDALKDLTKVGNEITSLSAINKQADIIVDTWKNKDADILGGHKGDRTLKDQVIQSTSEVYKETKDMVVLAKDITTEYGAAAANTVWNKAKVTVENTTMEDVKKAGEKAIDTTKDVAIFGAKVTSEGIDSAEYLVKKELNKN